MTSSEAKDIMGSFSFQADRLRALCFIKRFTFVIYLQGGPKNLAPLFLYALTLPNVNRFSKLFHYQNQEKICNNTVAKDPTTPQMCRYTAL